MKAALLALAVAAGLTGARAQAPRVVAASATDAAALFSGELTLQPRQLAQLVASRNAEIRYSRLGVEVAGYLSQAEASLYETVFFGNLRHEDRLRQRTVEERIASAATQSVLDERASTTEAGVRQRLLTAGEVAVSYRMVRRRNNIIASSTGGKEEAEFTGALVLSFKQPLWRNRGRDVMETDRRIADIEYQVQWAQFRQQVLKSTADALNLYWQLYRAEQVRLLRDESVRNVRKMAQDVEARVEAGRVPASNRIEIRSTLLSREAELTRSDQAAREAESRVMTALSLSPAAYPSLRLRTSRTVPPLAASDSDTLDKALDRALKQWPPYLVSQLRLEQNQLRLRFAENQRKPALDLTASYSGTGLAYERSQAKRLASTDHYPEWSVGLNFEMPLGGNGRAGGQYSAQAVRARQSEIELDAIRTSLANDLAQRRDELDASVRLVEQMEQDLKLRQALLDAERDRYNMGLGQLGQWLQRENDVVDSRQRLVEAVMRVQQARVAWQFAQGGLLDEYDIALRNE